MGRPVRTETIVRELDAQGNVVRETVTVVTVAQPTPADTAQTGMYL